MTTHYEREEVVGPGLKYTEETGRTEGSLPVRDCSLWHAGVDEPISGLHVLSFQQRFGAVSISTEGIGGVETIPAFRRQGYVSKLLIKAIEGIAKRVSIAFVSDAIEDLYEKFGFVNCVAEAYLSVPVRNVERMADRTTVASPRRVRGFSHADLPAMVTLYNQVHAHRPWTHARAYGTVIPTQYERVVDAWFPGGGAQVLPLPYAHTLDRY